MNPVPSILRGLSLLLLVAMAVILNGCATAEPENEAVRPWNAPKSWETGLPAGMMEGR